MSYSADLAASATLRSRTDARRPLSIQGYAGPSSALLPYKKELQISKVPQAHLCKFSSRGSRAQARSAQLGGGVGGGLPHLAL